MTHPLIPEKSWKPSKSFDRYPWMGGATKLPTTPTTPTKPIPVE